MEKGDGSIFQKTSAANNLKVTSATLYWIPDQVGMTKKL